MVVGQAVVTGTAGELGHAQQGDRAGALVAAIDRDLVRLLEVGGAGSCSSAYISRSPRTSVGVFGCGIGPTSWSSSSARSSSPGVTSAAHVSAKASSVRNRASRTGSPPASTSEPTPARAGRPPPARGGGRRIRSGR